MAHEPQSARDLLAQALADQPELLDGACALFDYAQFLLDDDAHLTKSGALDGAGRELLQARALELLGGPPPSPSSPEEDSGEEDGDEADDEDADEPAP